ncbi:universal stress protein [Amycolatopsis sp. K13G38]|uniref:Universal stress protein n=1 Tax=Amycolatopsis acididurans TaxID=2724524 RepID=A0ABX1IX60_9PSEU|nr:universal stress protein [Amycolatopsis acididurans]NKQ52067.1 universal stress protein [Amycolatopsis acididurans]
MIVAGVDGSDSALDAVRWAAREAARRDAPLMLLHACYVPVPAPYTPIRLPRSYGDALLDQGRDWLDQARTAAREVADVPVRTALRAGQAIDQLVRASAGAELVVLGSRGLGGLTGLLLGSVAVGLAAHGHCPVVVVRGEPPEDGPVVVGVDGSALSDDAVEFAFEAALSRHVPLVAVHAHGDAGGDSRLLAEQLAPWQGKYPDIEVRQEVSAQSPPEALRDAAEGAQLLVVGSRGRGGLAGAGLGSTSQRLLHHATCPIAVVRPRP